MQHEDQTRKASVVIFPFWERSPHWNQMFFTYLNCYMYIALTAESQSEPLTRDNKTET